jgi:hypothetical protein
MLNTRFIPLLMMSLIAGLGGGAARAAGEFTVGNAVLERRLAAEPGGRLATLAITNKLTGRIETPQQAEEFWIAIAGQRLTAADFTIDEAARPADAPSGLDVRLSSIPAAPALELRVEFRAPAGANFITRQLTITNRGTAPVTLETIGVESLPLAGEGEVRNNGLSDTVAFLRNEPSGLLLCLDFPYQNLKASEGLFQAAFPPHETLAPGASLVTHRAVLGAYALSGLRSGAGMQLAGLIGELKQGQLVSAPGQADPAAPGHDMGEAEAWRECIDQLYPPHTEMPQLWSGREWEGLLEELREQWGGRDPIYRNGFMDYVREEGELYASLGFNNGWIGPEPAAWSAEDPNRAELSSMLAHVRDQGVRLGLYSNSNRGQSLGNYWGGWGMNPPFPWDIPGSAILDENGKTIDAPLMCFGSKPFQQAWLDMYLPQVRLGMGNILWDFLILRPCYDTKHGHVAGDLYQQVKGLMHCMEEIHKLDPGFADYGCLGWGSLTPHAARYMDMFYLADPWMEHPIPGLNQDVLLAESRRKQMVGFLADGLPPRLLANCDFFAWPDSPVPNYLTYRYQYMQALAISPNWTYEPQMLRDVPHKEYANTLEFIRFWNQWRKERWEILNKIKLLSPAPAIGVLEAYMHTDGERGYLFLVNPNYFALSKQLTIGEPIGLTQDTEFHLHEWYPESVWLLNGSSPLARAGETLTFDVPAFSVRLIEFVPARLNEAPGVWGLPMPGTPQIVPSATQLTDGKLSFERRTSIKRRIGLRLDAGAREAQVNVDGKPVPSRVNDGIAIFEDTPPANISGERPQPELRDWVLRAEGLEQGLAAGYNKGITGASTRFPLDSILKAPDPDKLLSAPTRAGV